MQKTVALALKGISPILPAILFLLYSCTAKNGSVEELKQMEQSLINSSKQINLSTETNLKALQEKTADWATMERAKIWLAKAQHIARISNEVYKFLDSIKMKLKEKKLSSKLINDKLISYQENVLNTDSSIRQEFRNSFDFLKPTSKTTTSSSLTTLQNGIKIVENKIIIYCHLNCGSLDGPGMFNSYSAILAQSSSYLKPGDELEITAGVGAFSKAAQPIVVINGKTVEIGEEGAALFKMKVSTIPGKYKIPVSISYFNQLIGKDEIKTIEVEYTVAKICDQ